MNRIADYKLEAISVMLRPEMGRDIPPEDLRKVLEPMRRRTITVADAARESGILPETIKTRLKRAGISPVAYMRRAGLYEAADVLPLLQSQKKQRRTNNNGSRKENRTGS